MKFTTESARDLLQRAGLFFDADDCEFANMLNLNDVFAPACSDGEDVPDCELPRLAELFWRYGWCGVLYWVSEERNGCRSEFCDVSRAIEFVRHEERIRRDYPNDDHRACVIVSYTLGDEP